MTVTADAPLRVVAFGDLDGTVWGAMLDAGEPAIAFGISAADGPATGGADAGRQASTAGAIAVRLTRHDGEWSLESDSCSLTVTPAGDAAVSAPVGAPADAPTDAAGAGPAPTGDERCRVHGTVVVDGLQREVDCPGILGRGAEVDVRRLDSIRGVWGWFADEQALSLLALRPRGRAGQDDDQLTATLFTEEGTIAVDEPRLSTAYNSDGLPTRASLELWIGEDETQYARRAAAEALGPVAVAGADGLTLQISPLRCHNRGLDGAGVYLLARF